MASLAFIACDPNNPDTPDTPDDPTPTEKAFSVSPETISVGADETSATINVTAEVKWSAKSDNSKFTLSVITPNRLSAHSPQGHPGK